MYLLEKNNSGKSIILNILSKYAYEYLNPRHGSGRNINIGPTEIYRGEKTGGVDLLFGSSSEEISIKAWDIMNQNNSRGNPGVYLKDELSNLVKKLSHEGIIWISRQNGGVLYPFSIPKDIINTSNIWEKLWNHLLKMSGGGLVESWIPGVINRIASLALPEIPKIYLIPAKRQIGERGEDLSDLSGRGLIDCLARFQNPSFDKQDEKVKFNKINKFLQDIIGKEDAILEIPSEREHILVHMDNKVLPLSSFGTGVHEVILIAAFCTIHDGSIMCIEEPEIHLHPLVQRKLILYLTENTKSQYFIATHSSIFIDAPNASIFHVENDGVQTYVRNISTKEDKRNIIGDLGYLASDIIQSNVVIWVEGPSDRLYLRNWISSFDEVLLEGVHYNIMFYGGALITHLSASDEALDEFIRLRDLNRNMAIVIDSDRDRKMAELKPHVRRLISEMTGENVIVWVTDGREIENYIDKEKLHAALKALHPRVYGEPCRAGPYDHAFYFKRDSRSASKKGEIYKEGDKVGAASMLCKEPLNLDILDLRDRVCDVVRMIRRANGMSEDT